MWTSGGMYKQASHSWALTSLLQQWLKSQSQSNLSISKANNRTNLRAFFELANQLLASTNKLTMLLEPLPSAHFKYQEQLNMVTGLSQDISESQGITHDHDHPYFRFF